MPASPRQPVLAILLIAVLSHGVLPLRGAAGQQLDAAAILTAIDRGVAYLKRRQRPKGDWADTLGYPGGVSALVTLALLNAGVPPDDPTVAKALGYLRRLNQQKRKTYIESLRVMTLCAASPKRDRETIRKSVEWIQQTQLKQGPNVGAWSYSTEPGLGDPSNSQFAVLALHEAERAGIGIRIDPEVWRLAADYWRRIQQPDGAWRYLPGHPKSGSMTCAGIGALLIASEAEGVGDARVVDGRVECCVPRDPNADAERIERAASWLGRSFSIRRNPGFDQEPRLWHYYYLYGLERAGRLGARRFFGDHDWYREGAEYLIQVQDNFEGSWRGVNQHEKQREIATAMALLFLAKGKRPVLMAKLAYDAAAPDPGWNAHGLDAAHLTRNVERAWGLDLTWQRVDPRAATIEDLLQSPVLYLSGSKASDLAPLAGKLRGYIDRGGFVFAEACCGDPSAFRRDFERMVDAMFPEPEYGLRRLDPPPSHPLWRMERLVRPESPYIGKLYGVEYGCRTCVVYSDEDLSCYWELDRAGASRRYPPAVRRRIEDANTVGLNVLAYATNREPLGKEETIALSADEGAVDVELERGVIGVAKLRHGGGCDDAPGALANLTRAALQGEAKLQVATSAPLINITDPNLPEYLVCFMHGRHDFRLTASERRRLRDYLINGGTLLADSICASEAFAAAFRREIGNAFPDVRLERVPADDPLLTDAYGGADIREVTLRDPQPAADDEPLAARSRRVAPELEGLRVDGRWVVLFSRHDLSCALERHEAIQCRGYSRRDAARIGLNVFLYAVNQ